jgi:hypothetical protein
LEGIMIKLRNPLYRPALDAPAKWADLSPAERYAATIRETAVDEILKTIKSSKTLGMLLVLLVIVISFQHQRDFFAARHAGEIGSIGLPVIFDVSIIFFVRQISTTGMKKLVLMLSAGGLLLPVGASATINFVASPDPLVGWAYVVAIGLVAVIEVVKALAGPDPEALSEAEHKADTISANVAAQQAAADALAQQAAALQAAADAAAKQAADEAARRSEIARKAAETRRDNAAKAEAAKAERLADRRARAAAKKLEELAPTSPGHPAVILTAADREALAYMTAKS